MHERDYSYLNVNDDKSTSVINHFHEISIHIIIELHK